MKIKFLFIVLLLPVFVFAQSNYKPGYVVNLKGDTLKGFINYKEWNQNPSAINFKTAVADKVSKKLTTDDIKFFNIDGFESYQKFTGAISTDYTDAAHLSYGRDTTFKVTSVFLKIIADGKNVMLLAYVDDIRSHYYIEEAPLYAPKELVYHIHIDNNAQIGAVKTVVDNDYITQLYFLAQKYNMLTTDLQLDMEHMSYNGDDIIKIVNKINGVTEASATRNNGTNSKIKLFAGVGVSVTNSVPEAVAFKSLGATNYTSVLPFVTAGFNLPLNANIERLILRCELTIGGIHYYTSYNNKAYPYLPVVYKYSSIESALTPQILYNFFNTDDLKFFGSLGFSFSYYKYSNASYAQKNGDSVPFSSANPYEFVSFNIPIVFKAGIRLHKKLEIYTSYISTSPVSTDEVFRLNFSSFQTGLNYYLK